MRINVTLCSTLAWIFFESGRKEKYNHLFFFTFMASDSVSLIWRTDTLHRHPLQVYKFCQYFHVKIDSQNKWWLEVSKVRYCSAHHSHYSWPAFSGRRIRSILLGKERWYASSLPLLLRPVLAEVRRAAWTHFNKSIFTSVKQWLQQKHLSKKNK